MTRGRATGVRVGGIPVRNPEYHEMPENGIGGLDYHCERIRKDLGIKLSYHTNRSERSEAGWVDRVYVGPGGALFRELKTETGKVSAAQRQWIDALHAAGLDVDVWRPADLRTGRIARELAAIARPRTGAPQPARPPALADSDKYPCGCVVGIADTAGHYGKCVRAVS